MMRMTRSHRSVPGELPLLLLALATLAMSASVPLAAQQGAATPTTANASAAAPAPPPPPTETVTGTGPNGAKMRCRDGSYHPATASDDACDAKGGVLVRFPLRRVPQRAPQLPRLAAPAANAPQTGAIRSAPEDAAKREVEAPRPPAGATLLCGDGSFIVADTARVRCAGKGGVSLIYPQRRRP